MRWDNLFDDLESQLEQGLSAEEVDVRAEEERLRLGRLTLRERILSIRESYERAADYDIRVHLAFGETLAVRPATIGKDWFSGDIRDGAVIARQCIVPFAAVRAVALTGEQVRRSLASSPPDTAGSLAARLGFGFVLRDLCRRRAAVEIVTGAGAVFGTIDRVGRDHLDIAVHEPGEPRRESAVKQYRLVPFDEVGLVRL